MFLGLNQRIADKSNDHEEQGGCEYSAGNLIQFQPRHAMIHFYTEMLRPVAGRPGV
jgi:hypothetical protein